MVLQSIYNLRKTDEIIMKIFAIFEKYIYHIVRRLLRSLNMYILQEEPRMQVSLHGSDSEWAVFRMGQNVMERYNSSLGFRV